MFKKTNIEPLNPYPSETTDRILQTYEHLHLDPTQTMLVGSAAAALYGIFLEPDDPVGNVTTQRPSDLDLAASPRYMEHLFQQGTVAGVSIEVKPNVTGRVGLRITTPDLPVDILTHFRDGRDDIHRFHDRFMAYHAAHSQPIAGSDMRVITLDGMRRELRARAHDDPKARIDLANLHAQAKR